MYVYKNMYVYTYLNIFKIATYSARLSYIYLLLGFPTIFYISLFKILWESLAVYVAILLIYILAATVYVHIKQCNLKLYR
jgi:hypothetical protein